MSKRERFRLLPARGLLVAVLAVAGAACGGGGGGGSTTPPAPANRAPVANAGADQAAKVGDQVTLNGAGSTDPDGDSLSYAWTFSTRPAGSQATLTGSATASPRFTPDVGGRYAVSLSVSDGSRQDADTVVVNANAAPDAIAGPDQSVDAGSTVTLDGRSSTDPDGDAITYAWTLSRPNGSQAVLSDATASMPSFVADLPGVYVASLVVSDALLDSVPDTTVVTANDVVINTPPSANAGADQSATVGDPVTLDGSGSSDADGDGLSFSWSLTSPVGSSATLDNATVPVPTFGTDVVGTYTATLVVNDGQENSAPDTVDVVVDPVSPNTLPTAVASASSLVVAEGDLVQLDGRASNDADGNSLSYSWSLSPPSGSGAVLSDSTAEAPTFVADTAGTYAATLVVNDGLVNSAPAVVTISATQPGVNTPPVADAGLAVTIDAGSAVSLDGSASNDADGDPLSFAWTLAAPAGSSATLAGADTAAPSFTADLPGTYTATLRVDDGQAVSAPDSVIVTARIVDANEPPVAHAGPDRGGQIGQQIDLDGRGSLDADGDPLAYSWSLSLPQGSAATLANPDASMPSFIADVAGTYTATLTVNDGSADSAPDSVTITVSDPDTNARPTAAAGPDQAVLTGTVATLDGRGSNDPDGDSLTYAWSLSSPTGSAATLADPTSPVPTFAADLPGTYVATLVVDDGKLPSSPDSVSVTASTPPSNGAPVADAGPNQSIQSGATVTLDGTSSTDLDGDPLSFAWTLNPPAGSQSQLTGADTSSPTFVTDLDGDYVAALVVNDGQLDSAPDSVTVIATTPPSNFPPVAQAGSDQSVFTGDQVTLDGSASSDPDGDPLTFAWSLQVPPGSAASLSDPASETPSFVPDVGGTYVATLIVDDGQAASAADSVSVTVTIPPSPNSPPVADAGSSQTVNVGQVVTLNGIASSDADGDPLTFSWTLSRPAGSQATLSDPTFSAPQFTADVTGTYTATLVVSDGQDSSAPDGVDVIVSAPATNTPPVADAGGDVNGQSGDQITLDGSGSRDDDGDPLSFIWSLASPQGSQATLADANTAMPRFTADLGGTYVATLVVSDGTASSAPDSATITIAMPPTNGRPIADAGADLAVETGQSAQLDGRGSSDPDGDPLTYAWTLSRPAGSVAMLSATDVPAPTLIPDVAGVYTASLVVSDGVDNSAADTVSVSATAAPENGRPVASAGTDQSVVTGVVVVLDGTSSTDPDGDVLSYSWSLSRPTGSQAVLSDAASTTPTFTADLAGTFTATLIVDDGMDSSTPDTVNVLVNTPPSAAAGPDQLVTAGTLVTLDGSASSDPDGDPLSFTWSLAKPAGSQAVLSNPSSASPSFVADLGGIYTATLTVGDGQALDTDSTVIVTNTIPVADAGVPQSVEIGTEVTLDGSASADADGEPLTYSWSLDVPAGSSATLSDTSVVNPAFTPDLEGSYTATLVVDDGMDPSSPDAVLITVTVPEVTVSGQITFDRVPHKPGNTPGLDYPNTFQSPARGVVVRAVQEFGPVLASGRTDDQGRYSFDLPGKTRVYIQARAQIERGGSPSWNFKVVDNTSNDALYALTGAVFDTGLSNVTADLNAGSGWDEVLLTYGDVRAAAPFAIIDTVYEAVQLIVGADPEVSLPSMNLNWSPFNRRSEAFDPDNGSIVTTAYFFSEGQIYVLGDQDVDTDEYDPHVIAHEFAHYVESMLGRTDSTGGPHTFVDELDPRLAFSEGWANAFSAMVLDDPIYKDSLLTEQAAGFAVDIESNAITNEGWFNESSVHSVLYDVFDNQADGVDATALGFGPIFEGMVGWHANSNALTSIYSLLTDLKAGRPADEPNIDALLEGQDIVGNGMDIWGSAATNNAGNNQDVLPIYSDLTVNGPAVEVCSISSFGQFNRLSNRRFLRFTVDAAGSHTIRVVGPINSDPDLALFRNGFLNQSADIVESEETLTQPLATGTYVLEAYEASNVFGGNDFGRPPGKTCLDVTVTR